MESREICCKNTKKKLNWKNVGEMGGGFEIILRKWKQNFEEMWLEYGEIFSKQNFEEMWLEYGEIFSSNF